MPLYLRGDLHFNAQGHRLLAEALRPVVEELLAETVAGQAGVHRGEWPGGVGARPARAGQRSAWRLGRRQALCRPPVADAKRGDTCVIPASPKGMALLTKHGFGSSHPAKSFHHLEVRIAWRLAEGGVG